MPREMKYNSILPNIYVTKEMFEKIRKYKAKTLKSMSEIVREALEEYFEK